jgi:hypothetical protein
MNFISHILLTASFFSQKQGATDTALMVSQVDHPDAMQSLLAALPSGRMVSYFPLHANPTPKPEHFSGYVTRSSQSTAVLFR